MNIFNRIAILMVEKNITPAQLAKELEISPALFTHWKNNTQDPSLKHLRKISNYFKIPIKFLIGDPPFDSAWDDFLCSRNAFVHDLWFYNNALFELFGVYNIMDLSLYEYIKFIDETIDSVVISPEGQFSINSKGWTYILQNPNDEIIKKTNSYPTRKPVPLLETKKIRNYDGIYFSEKIISYEYADVLIPEEYFFITIHDDSMINSGIVKGSLVLCKRQKNIRDNQIIICKLRDDKTIIRRYYDHDDFFILTSECVGSKPIIYPMNDLNNGEIEIIGIAKKVITKI